MKDSQIPPNSDLENACLSKINYDPAECQRIIDWANDFKDILIVLGVPGTGKTYLAAAMRNHFLNEYHKSNIKNSSGNFTGHHDYRKMPRFVFERDFFRALHDSIRSNQNYMAEVEAYAQSEQPIIIDDMGSQRFTEKQKEVTSFQREVWFNFIDIRINSRYPTMITTNLFPDDIKEAFEPRIHSRLFSVRNTVINLKGPDLRKIFT